MSLRFINQLISEEGPFKLRKSRYNQGEGRKQEKIIQRRQVSLGYQLKYLDKNYIELSWVIITNEDIYRNYRIGFVSLEFKLLRNLVSSHWELYRYVIEVKLILKSFKIAELNVAGHMHDLKTARVKFIVQA